MNTGPGHYKAPMTQDLTLSESLDRERIINGAIETSNINMIKGGITSSGSFMSLKHCTCCIEYQALGLKLIEPNWIQRIQH